MSAGLVSEGKPVYVQIGNDNAIEGYRDPTSDDPDLVRYRPLEGERVTHLEYPPDMGLQEAFLSTLGALQGHMAEGSSPAWIETDSDGLRTLLQDHWGLSAAKTSRPKTYGKATGADEYAAFMVARQEG